MRDLVVWNIFFKKSSAVATAPDILPNGVVFRDEFAIVTTAMETAGNWTRAFEMWVHVCDPADPRSSAGLHRMPRRGRPKGPIRHPAGKKIYGRRAHGSGAVATQPSCSDRNTRYTAKSVDAMYGANSSVGRKY